MMLLQHILANGTLRRVAVVRQLLLGAALQEPPVAFYCYAFRLSPVHATGHCWLSTFASNKAAHHSKYPQSGEGEPQSSSAPQTQVDQKEEAGSDAMLVDPLQDKSVGLVQRFKRTFKQYGKVMIPVHLLTSSVWFGTFYYAAMKGVNVVPFLEMIGLPESLVGLLRDSSSGYALTAYAMYKIATPARYTVTLGGTSLSIQYLRKHGYLSTPPPVKEYIQDKMEETKERFSEKMEETKERFSEKMEETKERFSEKMEETKDKLSERLQETKDRVSEGKAFFRKKNN
ncbi:protein FAM210A-like [Aulostomus maculatus]